MLSTTRINFALIILPSFNPIIATVSYVSVSSNAIGHQANEGKKQTYHTNTAQDVLAETGGCDHAIHGAAILPVGY